MTGAIHIREHHSLQVLLEPALTMTCPHCEVYAQMTAAGTPSWQWLIDHRPSRLGVSAVCPACRRPVFLISGPLDYEDDHIVLNEGWQPVIQPLEPFDLALLPEQLVEPVTEALACHRDGHRRAFVLLCQDIAEIAAGLLGPEGKLQLFNAVTEAAALSGVDNAITRLCRGILFDAEHHRSTPIVNASVAKVLLALVRDMLHEAFVRQRRMEQAMPRHADD